MDSVFWVSAPLYILVIFLDLIQIPKASNSFLLKRLYKDRLQNKKKKTTAVPGSPHSWHHLDHLFLDYVN